MAATIIAPPAGAVRSGPTPGALTSGVSKVRTPGPAKAPPTSVSGFQTFLNQQGYLVPVDGINGPLTQAAAADFRGSRNPQAWNVGHGLTSGESTVLTPLKGAGVRDLPNAPAGSKVPTQPLPAKPGQTAPVRELASSAKPITGPSNASLSSAGVKAPKPATPKVTKPAKPTAVSGAAGSDVATAKAEITAIIAPLIKQAQEAEAAQAAQGQSLIGGYTTNAENQLKGIDFAAPYAGAAQNQNAINAALLASLQGQGSGLEQDLGATLANAGTSSPLTATLTGGVGADTAGAANAQLAKGDATLSQLLQSGAAEGSYGLKLPAITALAGAQDTGKLQGQAASDLKTQLQSIEAQEPGLVQSELTNLSNARTSAAKNAAAEAIAAGYLPGGKTLTPKARASLASATGYDPVTGQPTARTTIGQTNADTSRTRATNAAKPKVDNSLSKTNGYLTDTNGDPILRGGQRVPVSKGGKTLSASQTLKASGTALTIAEQAFKGAPAVTDPNNPAKVKEPALPKLSYQAALLEMEKSGIPVSIATAALNRFYEPGKRGRPASAAQNDAAKAAGRALAPLSNGGLFGGGS